MTLIVTLYIFLMSAIGSHSQRTMADLEYELAQDVRNSEIELAKYNAQYQKRQQELQEQIRNSNLIRIKFYSCDYDRMFDMTYILHEIQIQYLTISKRANTDSERTSFCKRKIRRLYYQMEALRRLNPTLPTIEEIPENIRVVSSDSLIQKIYSSSNANGIVGKWYKLNAEDQKHRDNCIRHGMRLIAIYKTFLKDDSIMCQQYAVLQEDFSKTYNDAMESFKLLQHDIIYKHDMPFMTVIGNASNIFHDMANQEMARYKEWNNDESNGGLWVLLVQAVLGVLLAILIVNGLIFLTRKKPNTLVRLKRNKWLWIWAITDLLWFIFVEISLTFAPIELVVAGGATIIVFLMFLLSIRLSNIIVGCEKYSIETIKMYSPLTAMAFLVMIFRLFFVPDELLAIQLFPFSIGSLIWQMVNLRKYWAKVNRFDAILGLVTGLVLLAMATTSFFGYIYMSIAILYWWQCQTMMLCGIMIILTLLNSYDKHILTKRIKNYYDELGVSYDANEDKPIQITWLYDLSKKVIVPLLIINSIPICIDLAMLFFNAEGSFHNVFYKVFYSFTANDGNTHIVLSIYNLVLTISLFFIFRFIQHLLVSIYQQIKRDIVRRRVKAEHITETFVNYTLGSNIISFFVWLVFAITVCIHLQIPMESMAFIFAGLATGIGFALKDILNNLFYGMQLMAGRLKVGDYVICDNYRGAVKSISYQTTQMLTEEGALVCFGNADLFSKNFQNLTSHNPYEVNRVTFYVPYGCDLQMIENIARAATEELNKPDKYGRPLLSPEEGIRIEFREMGASSLEMAVRIGVIAQKRTWFLPVLRKAVYTELTKHGISIPYNQLDLHIVNSAEQSAIK